MGVDQGGPHLPADGPPDGRRLVDCGEEPVEQTPEQLLNLVRLQRHVARPGHGVGPPRREGSDGVRGVGGTPPPGGRRGGRGGGAPPPAPRRPRGPPPPYSPTTAYPGEAGGPLGLLG